MKKLSETQKEERQQKITETEIIKKNIGKNKNRIKQKNKKLNLKNKSTDK